VRDAVGDYFDRETLCVADCFFPSLPVTHHARKFECFCDPAAVFFAVQVDGQFHSFIVSPSTEIEVILILCIRSLDVDLRFLCSVPWRRWGMLRMISRR
jgi:hypothetical protein